jgi:hypothetical protein
MASSLLVTGDGKQVSQTSHVDQGVDRHVYQEPIVYLFSLYPTLRIALFYEVSHETISHQNFFENKVSRFQFNTGTQIQFPQDIELNSANNPTPVGTDGANFRTS